MKPLAAYGADIYSQFGEDGMIHEILYRIGPGHRRCVEFGAGDGFDCSNTANLWYQSTWEAVLIEPDGSRFAALTANVAGNTRVHCLPFHVRPAGGNSVDALLAPLEWTDVDFMSIDVDGDDYLIWEQMVCRPRIVCIEYNQSVPPHATLRQAELGDRFGQSAAALVHLAAAKRYELVGLTKGNLLFVVEEESAAFDDLERSLSALFRYDELSYIVTDYDGRTACVGQPPWGTAGPYLGATIGDVAPVVSADQAEAAPFTGLDANRLRRAYEAVYGRALYLPSTWHNVADPDSAAPALMMQLLDIRPPLVLIDVTHVGDVASVAWLQQTAAVHGYTYRHTGPLIALILDPHRTNP